MNWMMWRSKGFQKHLFLTLSLLMAGCNKETPSTNSEPATPAAAPAPIKPPQKYAQQVWVLGFDGVDPSWLKKWADEGKLPNVQKLMTEGSFMPLGSTNPPQSPVAWASFATGTNPGGHGIYDFIKRDPTTYLPAVGSGDVKPPVFSADGRVTTPPRAHSYRSGTSFWKLASDQGVVSTVLNVPFAFPPDELVNGAMLSGLGTPDIRGTNSTFTYFQQGLSTEEVEKGVAGGRLVALSGAGPRFEASFDGPWGPNKSRGTVSVTLEVKGKDGVEISLGERKELVKARAWSDWFDYRFNVSPQYTVRALGRFYVEKLEPLTLYMYPPNIHPEEPWLPFTSPVEYGKQLFQAAGPFKTVGWTHDTNALNSEKIDDKPWLEDVWTSMDKIGELGMRELERGPGSLFIWVETGTDRVSHMFTRATDAQSPRYDQSILKAAGGDPILLSYQRMDAQLGKFLAKATPETHILVISDHGFHTYRRGLHTNAWLLENGYLVLKSGMTPGDKTNLFAAVDWSQTRAYALGTGQIYINLQGREGRGIVTSEAYTPLVQELAQKLEGLTDPKTQEKPVLKAYARDDIYKGERLQEAPDIQVAFREGWRTSWETMLGGIPEGLFADNTKKWSGDHAASDVAETAGILLSNRKLETSSAEIIDIAPTVLSIFGLPKPAHLEGKDLFNGKYTQPALPSSPTTPSTTP